MSKIEHELEQFIVVLSPSAHEFARVQIAGIANHIKAKQVYANTLAVYAVDYYLQCLGFDPDWQHSNSHDRLLVQLANIADLKIKNIGTIECIPILSDEKIEHIDLLPIDSERLGYMAVRIDSELKTATILGFNPQISSKLKLNELKDLDYAIEYLTKLERPAIVKLSQWLHGSIDSAWETLDRVLNPQQLRLHYRGTETIERGRSIDLSTSTGNRSFTLVIDVKSIDDAEGLDVLVQVYPREDNNLPAGVELTICDDIDTTLTVVSKQADNWIQLNFTAMFDEQFTITVGYGDKEVTNDFIV